MMITKNWNEWQAKHYLAQYYTTPVIPQDEVAILSKIIPFLKKVNSVFPKALEFGIGPTLHHAVSLMPYVSELHVADLLPQNLVEIQKWLDDSPGAHNWDTYIQAILEQEQRSSTETVQDRKRILRKKITKVLIGNLRKKQPIMPFVQYPLVTSFYCADSVAESKNEWTELMNNLCSLVVPRGYLILSALRNATYYQVGKQYFPSAHINETDLAEFLKKTGFQNEILDIEVFPVSEWKEEGFDSIIVVIAQKN